ncbi:MAG: glycosyltransferase [Pyrinomonadaceae bacterium]
MNERATLLFYCQHSLGMGHLVRSLALAEGLQKRFRIVFLNGGPLPKKIRTPEGVEVVNLPPLGLDHEGRLVSRDRRRTVERARESRRRIILETYRQLRPQVVFIELFPFGRKKFADELLPMLDEARRAQPSSSLVCCSLRDILVGKKPHQQKHDERAVAVANSYFDAVMVHSDPSFARLEDSLCSHASLRVPVYYTGFVQAEQEEESRRPSARARQRQVLVSAGGGLVGETLFRAAIDAYKILRLDEDAQMKIVTGPFLPEDAWLSLRAAAHGQRGLSLKRFVPNLCAEMQNSVASVSQCGYNTALDILRAGVPALVVPFSEGQEDEQLKRARRLERLGAIRVMEQPHMDGARLAAEMRELLDFRPQKLHLDLNGARNTAHIVESLVRSRRSKRAGAANGIRNAKEAHT